MQPKIDAHHADVKHAHSIEDHANDAGGEYEHQEYPKVIGRDEDGREVVADSAEHEEQLLAENAEAEAAAVEVEEAGEDDGKQQGEGEKSEAAQ